MTAAHPCRIYIRHKGQNKTLDLDDRDFVIGRSNRLRACIESQDISREHLRVEIIADKLWITDLASTNGSYYDRKRLEPKVSTPYEGGEVCIGPLNEGVYLRFELEGLALTKDNPPDPLRAEASRIIELPKRPQNAEGTKTQISRAGLAKAPSNPPANVPPLTHSPPPALHSAPVAPAVHGANALKPVASQQVDSDAPPKIELAYSNKTIDAQEVIIRQKRKEIQQLEDNFLAVEQRLRDLQFEKAKVENVVRKIAEKEAEEKKLSERIRAHTDQEFKLQETIQKLEKERVQREEEARDLKNTVADWKKQSHEALEAFQIEKAQIQDRIANHQKEEDEARTNKTKAIDDLELTVKDSEYQKKKWKLELETLEAEIGLRKSQLQKDVETLEEQRRQTSESVLELSKQQQAYATQVGELKLEETKLKTSMEQILSRTESLQKDIEVQEAQLKTLSDSERQAKAELERAVKETEVLRFEAKAEVEKQKRESQLYSDRTRAEADDYSSKTRKETEEWDKTRRDRVELELSTKISETDLDLRHKRVTTEKQAQDRILQSEQQAKELIEDAQRKSTSLRTEAEQYKAQTLSEAQTAAEQIRQQSNIYLNDTKQQADLYAEQTRLSAEKAAQRVHTDAALEISQKRSESDQYVQNAKLQADQYVVATRSQADQYGQSVRAEADQYALGVRSKVDTDYQIAVQQGRDEAQKLLVEAENQKNDLVNKANQYAQETRAGADDFVAQKLKAVQTQMDQWISDAQTRAKELREGAEQEAQTRHKETEEWVNEIRNKVETEMELHRGKIEAELREREQKMLQEIQDEKGEWDQEKAKHLEKQQREHEEAQKVWRREFEDLKQREIQAFQVWKVEQEKAHHAKIQADVESFAHVVANDVLAELQHTGQSTFGLPVLLGALEKYIFNALVNDSMRKGTYNPERKSNARNFWVKALITVSALVTIGLIVKAAPQYLEQKYANRHEMARANTEEFLARIREARREQLDLNLEHRKEFQSSYLLNVLHNDAYLAIKQDPEVIKKWTIDVNDFFIKELQLDDRAIVQFITLEQSLLRELGEQRKVLNKLNYDVTIRQMKLVEQDKVEQMWVLLGGKEQWERMRAFERTYYEKQLEGLGELK